MHDLQSKLHTPVPDPEDDEEESDVKQPPVPPDQESEIIPQRDPPRPGEPRPLIARSIRCGRRFDSTLRLDDNVTT